MFDDDARWGSNRSERGDDARDREAINLRDVDPRDVFVHKA